VLALAILLCACTVKEERHGCPRIVGLDLRAVQADSLLGAGYGTLVVGMRPAGAPEGSQEELLDLGSLPPVYELLVPDDSAWLYVLSSPDMDAVSGGVLEIGPGSDCPALLGWRISLPPGRETTLPVSLHKDYCLIDISFERPYPKSADFFLVGEISGLGVDGEPVPGAFMYPLLPDSEGCCEVAVPRQRDASLRLLVAEDDQVVRYFAVGRFMEAAGYDWSAPDLPDISVRVRLSKGTAYFSVDLWSKTADLDIVF